MYLTCADTYFSAEPKTEPNYYYIMILLFTTCPVQHKLHTTWMKNIIIFKYKYFSSGWHGHTITDVLSSVPNSDYPHTIFFNYITCATTTLKWELHRIRALCNWETWYCSITTGKLYFNWCLVYFTSCIALSCSSCYRAVLWSSLPPSSSIRQGIW